MIMMKFHYREIQEKLWDGNLWVQKDFQILPQNKILTKDYKSTS